MLMLHWEKAWKLRSRLLSGASGRARSFMGSQRSVNKAVKLWEGWQPAQTSKEPKEAFPSFKILFMAWKGQKKFF